VEAPVLVEQRREVLDIGREQLLQLAVFEDAGDDRVRVADLLELALARRALSACRLPVPLGDDLQLIEEHLAELLRRAHVELAPGMSIEYPFRSRELG